MDDTFDLAKQHAISHIKWHYDQGYFPDIYPSIFRAGHLGADKSDFDWEAAHNKSVSDHEAFEALQRYCARQMRLQNELPRKLQIWVANVLDGICKRPPAPRGAPKKPEAMKFYLGQLIYFICKNFGLNPTKNPETNNSNCAVSAVLEALREIPEARDMRPNSYSGLVEAYYQAKASQEVSK